LDIVHQGKSIEDIELGLIRHNERIAYKILKSLLQTRIIGIVNTILEGYICGVIEEVRSFKKTVFRVINDCGR
jgi:hypothetical protein